MRRKVPLRLAEATAGPRRADYDAVQDPARRSKHRIAEVIERPADCPTRADPGGPNEQVRDAQRG